MKENIKLQELRLQELRLQELRLNKPFLKWAGGKTRVVKHIIPLLPKGDRLVEPFCGSGAVFLNTNYNKYLISDINADLINTFKYVQKEGASFINDCKTLFVPSNNTESMYKSLRSIFNNTQDIRFKSAIFIYLNRHCFNGLCRYNLKGIFNVPFGRYTKPYFPQKELEFFWEKSKKAVFLNVDFRKLTKHLKANDVIYCDPPYVPLTKTANFTAYNKENFKQQDHTDLVAWIENCGIPAVISNHDTADIRKAYKHASSIKAIAVQRNISCNGLNRKTAKELIAVYNGEIK